jgi:hypothetical protein
LGLHPKKASIPERIGRPSPNKNEESKVSVKRKGKTEPRPSQKTKKKGKEAAKSTEIYKTVEIPRVDLDTLGAKRSKSKDTDSSSNPVKRLFKRLF